MKWALSAIGVIIVLALWFYWEKRKNVAEPPASIVLLLREPRTLDVRLLAELLSAETGTRVEAIDMDAKGTPEEENAPVGDMIAGASPHFIAQVKGTAFAFHNLATPYVGNAARAGDSISELRLRKAVQDHKAWLSMDIIQPESATPENYRVIGRVLAHLVGPECLALYHPASNRLAPCFEETVTKLRSADPVYAVFGDVGMVRVVPIDADPRLRVAEAEARRRFHEFETAFRQKDGTRFSIKAPVSRDERTEHIWIEVEAILGDKIIGQLANDPVDLGELKLGSRVKVNRAVVEDWTILRGEQSLGMFTVPIVRQIQEEQSRKR